MILGDFNIHYDVNNTLSKKIKDTIEEFELNQLVCHPTHRSGHTLDWVVIPKGGDSVKTVTVDNGRVISDHFLITIDML